MTPCPVWRLARLSASSSWRQTIKLNSTSTFRAPCSNFTTISSSIFSEATTPRWSNSFLQFTEKKIDLYLRNLTGEIGDQERQTWNCLGSGIACFGRHECRPAVGFIPSGSPLAAHWLNTHERPKQPFAPSCQYQYRVHQPAARHRHTG